MIWTSKHKRGVFKQNFQVYRYFKSFCRKFLRFHFSSMFFIKNQQQCFQNLKKKTIAYEFNNCNWLLINCIVDLMFLLQYWRILDTEIDRFALKLWRSNFSMIDVTVFTYGFEENKYFRGHMSKYQLLI